MIIVYKTHCLSGQFRRNNIERAWEMKNQTAWEVINIFLVKFKHVCFLRCHTVCLYITIIRICCLRCHIHVLFLSCRLLIMVRLFLCFSLSPSSPSIIHVFVSLFLIIPFCIFPITIDCFRIPSSHWLSYLLPWIPD